MDPICHTFVGAAISQTGLGRKTAGGVGALILGANLPDIDGLAMLIDGDTALWIRRGWTHGVPAIVLLPIVLTGILTAWHRLRLRSPSREEARALKPRVLLGLSYLAVLTHPTLDWMNQYGMRWLMPIDGTWFYGDILFIVDPWLWLVIGGAVFLRTSRRIASLGAWAFFWIWATLLMFSAVPGVEPGKALWLAGLAALVTLRWARVGRDELELPARRNARAAVALASAYIVVMSGLASYARGRVHAELTARGLQVAPEGLMVAAVPVTPFRKQVVAESGDGYHVGTASLWPRFELELAPQTVPLPSPLVTRALEARSIRGFANWARFPSGIVEERDDGHFVRLIDVRYASRASTGFGTAEVALPAVSSQ